MRAPPLLLTLSAALFGTASLAAPSFEPFKIVVRAPEPVIRSGQLVQQDIAKAFALDPQAVARSRKIGRLSSTLEASLNHALHAIERRKARAARFRDEGGHWIARQVTGWQLNETQARAAILGALLDGEQQVQLEVKLVEPARSVQVLAERGVLYHVATGESSYRGSPPFRVTNVLVGAGKLDGRFVAPGQELNFNKTVGEISAATGFVKGYVISNGTLEKEDGGGICQVSTTVFRMAYAAGLPITERHEHSHRVEYYDPVGLEATVYAPYKNLRFKNDTAKHLFVQASWDTRRQTLRFDLFGAQPDRQVSVTAPVLSNFRPPAPPSFSPDARVRLGGQRLLDLPMRGVTAVIHRTVKRSDGTVKQDTLKSVYKPWGAVYGVAPDDARLR